MSDSPKRKPVVLLCEDETPILRVTEMKFMNAGFEVDCARDGREGWECIQQRIPDILITDWQMPYMDGMELLSRVRDNEATETIPVIIVTAKGLEFNEDKTNLFNAIAVINKPFSPRELLALVNRTLGRKAEEADTTISAEV